VYKRQVFNQSSAQLYAWTEEQDPEMFEEIQRRVEEGRWEPVGGSWVEPDCQMPGGESFVRQFLYGQRYFETRFGRRSTVAWLPDTFGFSPAIPQLLRGAGITGFFTYKLNWSEANRFPHDLFLWEGLDGSRVVAHAFENPGTDYNGDVTPCDLLGTWRNFRGKRRHSESLFSFGWGDGGGGPTGQMLENYARLKESPALPRLRMARVDDFFRSLPKKDLPRWVGELYLELHRGTLTSQSRIKKLNREAEHRLLEAETFATIAALRGVPYPAEEIERLWKAVLFNQFHDILPGSSIAEVFVEARDQLEEAVAGAEKVRDAALRSLGGNEVIVANAALCPRPLSVVVPGDVVGIADGETGKLLPAQRTGEGLLVHDPGRQVPGLGFVSLTHSQKPSPEPGTGVRISEIESSVVLENELLRAEVGADGTIHSLYDKVAGREVLAGRANQLWAYADKPREWDAWDIDEDYEREGEEIPAQEIRVVEKGPLRAALRVVRRWRGSRIAQTYRLLSGSRRLDVVTEIDWRERQVLLRVLFPLDVRAHEASFETMYGVVRRPVHRNTSWEAARFEVAAHRFVDLSEIGYGVALLNDGRYGHSARDNVLGISLLRSPLYPDPLADEGHHSFTYSLFPHPGDWTEAGVVEEAFALNSPLRAVRPDGPDEGPVSGTGFVAVEGVRLALGSLKRAEDDRGFVLRLYEPRGARGVCILRFAGSIRWVVKTDLLENEEETLDVRDDAVHLRVTPFEVVTLRVEPDAEIG
jgi:alpha-mannosidase